jgi:hypothetical protein
MLADFYSEKFHVTLPEKPTWKKRNNPIQKIKPKECYKKPIKLIYPSPFYYIFYEHFSNASANNFSHKPNNKQNRIFIKFSPIF